MSDGVAPPLRDYQTHGAGWIYDQLQDHKAVLLADDMGLGKTLQALTAAQKLGAKRILIICPAGARRVWSAEIARWVPGWSQYTVLVEPGTKITDAKRWLDAPRVIFIVGYDEFSDRQSQLANYLRSRRFGLMILDEAHFLKNPSNRTLAIYGHRGSGTGVQAVASKVILLTGTPTPNHAGELWQHYRALWPEALKNAAGRSLSQAEFEERFTKYKDTVFGRQVTGSRNQKILRDALHGMVLRRRKDEVLTELPPLVLQDIPLTVGGDNGRNGRTVLARSYAGLGAFDAKFEEEEGVRAERERVSAKAFGGTHAGSFSTRDESSGRGVSSADRGTSEPSAALTDDELLKVLRRPDAALATARRELGLLKVGPTITWVQERMASVNKLLIFAWHHGVIDQLKDGLLEFDPVVVTGNSSPNARALAVEDFQTRPGTRIFIGQILASGVAITLTAANEVAVVEPSWVPGENVQAICRAHRLGQRDSVLASFLFLPGTLDERIMQVFRRKAGEIAELQGDPDRASSRLASKAPLITA